MSSTPRFNTPLLPSQNDSSDNDSSKTVVPPSRLSGSLPGSPLPGYEILEELGRGGMGVVYKARQKGLNRLVALKMILCAEQASIEDRMRFDREAKALARLNHPNIVEIYEINEIDGKPCFSLELVTGGALEQKIDNSRLSPLEAARLVETLARAMHAAHKADVIHRDLKPGNILITEEGEPKITDFGLAKHLKEARQTMTDAIMGTPAYMAPEQASGEPDLGPAVDTYALGAILYECLTGHPPFWAPTPTGTLYQVLSTPASPPSRARQDTPKDLDTICLKCLEKEPHQRYQSAEVLADELRRFQEGEPIQARPIGSVEKLTRWMRRNALVSTLLIAVLLVLAAGATVSTLLAIRAGAEAKRADGEAHVARLASRLADDRAEKEQEARRKAQKAETLAGQRAIAEQKARQASEWSLYRAQIQLARNLWEEGNITVARATLEQTRASLRHWEHQYLQTYFQRSLVLQSAGSEVEQVHFSPDGSQVLAATAKGLKLWDLKSQKLLSAGRLSKVGIAALAYSPDGRQLLTATRDLSLRLWHARSLKFNHVLEKTGVPIGKVAISPNGRYFATGAWNAVVNLWSLKTRKVLHSWKEKAGIIQGLAFSPDSRQLATSSLQGGIRIHNVSTGKLIRELNGHRGYVRDLAYSPDGRYLISASADRTLKLWDAKTGVEVRPLIGHRDEVTCTAFSPDGMSIVSGSDDGSLFLWDLRTEKILDTLRGHSGRVTDVCFSPDGRLILSGGDQGEVRLWSVAGGRPSSVIRGAPLNRLLVVKGVAERLLALTKPPVPGSTAKDIRKEMETTLLAISPDGRTIASAPAPSILVTDAQTGATLRQLDGHKRVIVAMTFSNDGKLLASSSRDDTVRIWDRVSGKTMHVLRGHRKPPLSLSFSPEGEMLLTGDDMIKLWDVSSGDLLHSISSRDEVVLASAFSPSGRQIAWAGKKHRLTLWDRDSGEIRFFKHESRIRAIAFDPKENHVITGDSRGVISIWDLEKGEMRHRLTGHQSNINAVVCTHDGRRFFSACQDKLVKVWDLETGTETLSLSGHRSPATVLAFDAQERRVVSASCQGSERVEIHTWQAKPQKMNASGNPDWHQKQASKAKRDQNRFAEAFHLKRWLLAEPWRERARIRLAYLLEGQDLRESLRQYWTAILMNPQVVASPIDRRAGRRGDLDAREGDYAKALSELALAVRQKKSNRFDWHDLALCQLQQGDIAGYQATQAQVLTRLAPASSGNALSTLLSLCTLGPCHPNQKANLLKLAQRYHQSRKTGASWGKLGVAYLRVGMPQRAAFAFRSGAKLPRSRTLESIIYRSILEHQSGNWKQAKKLFQSAKRFVKRSAPKSWQTKVRWEIWLREARSVLSKFPPMPKAS